MTPRDVRVIGQYLQHTFGGRLLVVSPARPDKTGRMGEDIDNGELGYALTVPITKEDIDDGR
jgi:hypothetical protein